MRFLLSLLIWILFVGGLWSYTWYRDAKAPEGPPVAKAVARVEGNYRIEITPTFAIAEDPFALQSDTGATPSVELRLNGISLKHPDVEMSRGKVIQIRDLPELIAGFNEIYISASPPISENDLFHGLRVRLIDDDKEIVDKTLWAGHGAIVSGAVNFEVAAEKDHDHEY